MNIIRPLIPLATILFSAMNSMVAADLPEKEAPFTPRILNFRIKVAITLLFLLFGFTSVSIGSEVPEKDSNFAQQVDNLKNNARKEGKIPVIIKLKVPHKPEGMLKPDKVKEQRDNIKKAGDEVSKEIKKVDTKAKITSFDSLPYVATLANENMINALANNPNVVLIYQDSSSEPALDISIPLVNADDAFSLGFSGQGQTVAVIDTGVRLDHEFFNGKIVSQACYSGTSGGTSLCPGGVNSSVALGSGDDCPLTIAGCGHGTAVAGAAVGKNGQFSGVAKDANLIAIKTATKYTELGNNFIRYDTVDIASALVRVTICVVNSILPQ